MRHEQRLARILRRVRQRDPETYKLVVEKLNHNRSHTANQQLIKDLAVGSDDRAVGSGDFEGASQSGGNQAGANGGGKKEREAAEVDQPWERPPTFQVSFIDAFPCLCSERRRAQRKKHCQKPIRIHGLEPSK